MIKKKYHDYLICYLAFAQTKNMIKLTAIGNLGRDGELKNINGKNVINFSVAHTEKFKDNTGKEKTVWIDCSYWTDKTGIAPYLKKGTQVYVEGTPDIRTYQTQDGKSGASLTLRVASIQLLGGRQSGEPAATYMPQGQTSAATFSESSPSGANDMSEPSDDLPF